MKDIQIEKYIPKKHQHKVDEFFKDIDGVWLNLNYDYISADSESASIHEDTINQVKAKLKTILLKSDFDKMTRSEITEFLNK